MAVPLLMAVLIARYLVYSYLVPQIVSVYVLGQGCLLFAESCAPTTFMHLNLYSIEKLWTHSNVMFCYNLAVTAVFVYQFLCDTQNLVYNPDNT